MDIVELVRTLRSSEFVSQVYLKKHQLNLIPNFKEYQIVAVKQPKSQANATNILPLETVQPEIDFLKEIEANFKPLEDTIDRNILQKITGFGQGK